MKKAFFNRDASYDGIFLTGVRTTGIFCRPTCPAKRPLPEHLAFFGTAQEALFAGYRPCKRCRPLQIGDSQPEWLAQLLTELDESPAARIRDGELQSRGLDPVHVRRYFRRNYGMTFQAYSRGLRMSKAFRQIRQGGDLDDAALDHGYESNSGFREAFFRTFGAPPGKSRDGNCVTVAWIESPLGPLVAGTTDKGICLLEFTDRRMLETQFKILKKHFAGPWVPGLHPHLARLREELAQYFAGTRMEFAVPLDFPGSVFQQKVWGELRRIPYGQTCSYDDLARRLGNPNAMRAVGGANGKNRIAILLPCHRVVNKDGELGGYGGGLWRKRFLLDLERSNQSRHRAAGSGIGP
ncbi:MAG: methylated-DNA--[protein]-cysteine S-methyltransferase [Pseudomonadota bacterium]